MKHNILKSIFISLILVLGVSNAWADIVFSGGYIYFDNSIGINQTYIQLCARQSGWTGVSTLNKIDNTKLHYVANPQGSGWGGILGWVVIGNSSKKSNSNFDNWSSYGWCSNWNTYGFNSGSTYLIVPTSTSKSQSVNTSYYSGGYSALNSKQTIKTAVNDTDANSKATISITSYKMTGNGTVTKQEVTLGTGAKESYVDAARTATTTLTVGTVATGYQFDGWYTATTGETQLSSSTTYTYYPTAATTVYARFSAKKYTITYKDQNNSNFSGTHESGYPTEHTYGVETTLKNASKAGYTFGGWFTSPDCSGTAVTKLGAIAYTSNITLYAKWTPKTYTITLNANGGASDGSATATYNSSTITNLTQPTRTDYRCNGYYTAALGGTLVLNIDGTLAKNVSGYTDANGNWTKDGNATLYAQWTYDVTEYTVNFGAGTGFTSYGSVTAKNNSTSATITSPATVRSGQNITFTATPETGYIVEGWYTNAACTTGKHNAGNTTYTTTITAATNVYVKFAEQTWPVSFVASTGGTVSPAEEQTVGVITGVNISATPETGYTFAEWTSSAGGEFEDATALETNFTPTAETTVTANFTENLFAITVQSSDNNHGTVTQSTDKAGIATTITITATPNIGYRFVKWTATDSNSIIIANANNASTTITAKQAGTVTANFEALPPVTIYFKPTSAWKNHNAWFAVYYWENKDGGNKKEGWLTLEDGDGHGNLYTAEIPGGYNNLIFVRLRPSTADGYTSENSGLHWNNQWEQTEDLTTPTDDKVLYDMESKNAATHLYLKPNGNWKSDGARFAACFMDDKKGNHTWRSMTINNDIYSCEIPTNKTYVIFCRMNPGNDSNDWNNKWNQTGDLTIPTDGKNLFTLKDGVWEGATETWSTIYDNSKWAIYDPEENEEEQVVYLKPTGYWSNDNPTFVAHIWNNSSNEDIPMTAIGSGYYACTIPIGYHSVVFYRKSTDGKTIWNQTSDLSIPTHRANCYTIKSTGEGTTTKATGKWNEFMLMRDYHDNQEINDTTGIETVNSVITFHKATLTNNELSVQERALYWISFPYNVNLNKAFGFGEYGINWIIEYYDGAERAEKGCWIEDTYWKYIENPQNVTLEVGVGYVLALDLSTLGDSIYNDLEQISLYFPAADDIATITGGITSTYVPTHLCEINRPTGDGDRRIIDSNWNIIGVPSFADVHDSTTQVGDVNFYYQWNPATDTYSPQPAATFQTMHAYMIQFAGTIDWGAKTAVSPAAIAARKNAASTDQYTLRLVLQQEGKDQDQTFIRLLAEGATNEFDMNVDLSKIINRGANIYSLIGKEEAAANVLPIEESIIPIGLDIEKAGAYTFAMPDGTDGITAILIDYETQTEHNLLTTEYTVNLNKGISNKRFALRVLPHHVATNIESLLDGNCNQNVQKYIINGQLFIKNNGHIYDIQGRQVK